jgi:hypothetical protein
MTAGSSGAILLGPGGLDPGGRQDLFQHPNELCPQLLEEFERGLPRTDANSSSSQSSSGDSSLDPDAAAYDDNVRQQGVARSAFVQELLLSLLALDGRELDELAAGVAPRMPDANPNGAVADKARKPRPKITVTVTPYSPGDEDASESSEA